ncbi:hypothetical protein ACFQL0_13845 [Haloplanus litoreus]
MTRKATTPRATATPAAVVGSVRPRTPARKTTIPTSANARTAPTPSGPLV